MTSKKNKRPEGFFLEGDGDSDYMFNRDHENRQYVRDAIASLWKQYEDYCPDTHFQENAKTNFNAMVWQMRLTVLLKNNGLELLPVAGQGPDIIVKRNSVNSLIETVAARPGEGNDSVPQPPQNQSYRPPFDKIILRIRNSISAKMQQRERWLEASAVKADVPFVVAITSGEMSDSVYPPDKISFAERAVFGIDYGAWKVTIGAPAESAEFNYGQRESITRSSGAAVSTNIFLDPAHAALSAVVYTPHHAVNYLQFENGQDIQLIHNPLASNPLPRGYFGFGEEVWVEDGALQRTRHQLNYYPLPK